MSKFRKVVLTLELFVPVDINNLCDIADYINDKLENDIEFFGEVDSACIELTDELLDYELN